MKILASFCLVLWISCAAGCSGDKSESTSTDAAGAVVGANYTGNGIQWFTVDGAGGGNVLMYSGGGSFVCCASYPKNWTPGLKVTVKWERSDGRDESGKQWRLKTLQKIVGVDKYMQPGDVYVLFLPDDEIKVIISDVGVGNPNFPGRPGYPGNSRDSKGRP